MEIRYKVMMNTFDFRLEMVRSSQKYGVSETAHLFEVSRPTVRKWRDRFNAEGLKGLKDRSRRPHHSPNRLDDRIRAQIIRLKGKMPHCGGDRMRNEFGIKASTKTIQKVFREEGLTRPRRSKRSKQRDLRAWKEANFVPLRYWQIDTKDCSDIPYYAERIWNGSFPRYLYQARDVRTGTLLSAFAYENTSTNAMLFMRKLFTFLTDLGMDLGEVVVQTDNGTEYVRNSRDLTKQSPFEGVINDAKARLVRIPPRQCTYQSEVERANGIIEYELLEIERWRTKAELVGKTTAWEYYFNRIRPNSYHQNMTPYQRMKKAGISSRQAEQTCLWTVTILDDPKFKTVNFQIPQSGNHVCKDVTSMDLSIC
ncbi:MAG: helix-turn-helix domain-containing protein [Candidatus Marinimicrobia bacterium]|nr:helix-turn-helix domain-containing protein [Candidatus Neomarinimicrobiota bacterium]